MRNLSNKNAGLMQNKTHNMEMDLAKKGWMGLVLAVRWSSLVVDVQVADFYFSLP